eukprot:3471738-Pyramimonas_sp.AAC.5
MGRTERSGGAGSGSSPGVDGQKGLRLQFAVDTTIPFSARHFEYSTEYSTLFPADRLPLAGRQSTPGL